MFKVKDIEYIDGELDAIVLSQHPTLQEAVEAVAENYQQANTISLEAQDTEGKSEVVCDYDIHGSCLTDEQFNKIVGFE